MDQRAGQGLRGAGRAPGADPTTILRKFVTRARRSANLVERGSLPQRAAQFLHAAVAACKNLLVSGATRTGKPAWVTTKACQLIGEKAARTDSLSP